MNKNIDIYNIHKTILANFDAEYKTIDNLKLQLQQNPNDVQLINKINLIDNGIEEAIYLSKTSKIFEKYDKLLSTPKKKSFLEEDKKIDNNSNRIVQEFLNIANKYINPPIYFQLNTNIQCSCGNTQIQKIDDTFVCINCDERIQELVTVVNNDETTSKTTRINSVKRYVYERKDHFATSIKKFQGLQTNIIPQTVIDKIKEKMVSYKITPDKLSKDHIYEFLKITNNTSYYEDINYIHKTLTGKQCCNLSNVEDTLFKLFDIVDKVYDRLKPDDRRNSMNSQFRLYKLLLHINFPCKEEDFYILKTRENLIQHDLMWKKICQELEWTFEPLI